MIRPKINIEKAVNKLAMSLLTILSLNACGIPEKAESDSLLEPLRVSPSNVVISSGRSVQLFALGGKRPYKYSKQSGDGSISQSGDFTPPIVLGTGHGSGSSSTVKVTDANGSSATVNITVLGQADPSQPTTVEQSTILQIWAWPGSVRGKAKVTLYAQNGTPPYTFSVSQGAGTISGNILKVPNLEQTIVVQVSDGKGLSANLTIPCAKK